MSFAGHDALERLIDAQAVESAFRAQASRAVERYNAECLADPHSREADTAWKLRKEALSQWEKTRRNVTEARTAWKLQHDMDVAAVRASIRRVRRG